MDLRFIGFHDEVRNAVEVPDDGVITGVDIETLLLWVDLRPENEATSLTLCGEIIELSGDRSYMFQNYPVPLLYPDTPVIGINSLISLGIGKLKGKIESYLLNLGDSGYLVGLSGNSTPAGSRIAVDIFLLARATVKYDQCVDVPSGFMGGDDCTIDSGDDGFLTSPVRPRVAEDPS